TIATYLYDPEFVRANPDDFTYTAEEVASLERRNHDFYAGIVKLLAREKGQEMEKELESLLERPGLERDEYRQQRIKELTDGLAAFDILQKHPHKIESSRPQIGDECVEVRAVYTFPEEYRSNLLKASGDVGTVVHALIRQGAALAHIKLETNNNSLWDSREWTTLLRLVAEKLQPYRTE
ncbi:MAG: hypothetical protein RDV41_10210, partial [Planctomycetota bacterium]|nr:hypothetical protein [Planctomycetota bacterium]